jgi:hypothetical protein
MGKTTMKVEMMIDYLKKRLELQDLSTDAVKAILFEKFKCSRYMAKVAIEKWKTLELEMSIASADKFMILGKIKGCSPEKAAEIELRARAEKKGYEVTEFRFDSDKGTIVGKLKSKSKI